MHGLKINQNKYYKVISAPMLTYGSENWVLNRSESREIETAEMCFLRCVSGYTFTDQVRNMTMRYALQMYALEERVQGSRSKWHNHVLRIDASRLDLKVKNYQPDGRSNIGRPRRRW
jgi:hypothetical protein